MRGQADAQVNASKRVVTMICVWGNDKMERTQAQNATTKSKH